MLNDKQQRLLRKFLPNSGLFDLIMFCLFLAVGPFLSPAIQKEVVYTADNQKYLSWRVGILFLVAGFTQVLGFWLKRKRIAQSFNHQRRHTESESVNLIGGIFMSVMHLLLFGVLVANDGINYINNQSIWWLTIIKVIAVLLPTVVALLTINYSRHHPQIDRLNAVNTAWDVTATVLLSISCLIVVSVYWELFFGNLNFNLNDGKIFINLLLSLLLFAGFLLLYLPARWAYLLMDYKSFYTWIRLAIVFLPFLKGLWIGWKSWLW